MGYYINEDSKGNILPNLGKAEALLNDGATPAEKVEYQPNLVCVVNNGMFEAAAYAYSPEEFNEFNRFDGRPKKWLIHPQAKELAK